jgi:phage gpG-like protein
MPVKIKGIKATKINLRRILPKANSLYAREMKRSIVDIIVEKIVSGISPVKGKNRYKQYSDGYSKVKGRKAPVDLVDTGDMLGAMVAKQTNKNKTIVVEFRGKKAQELAAIHQFGKGKMPERQMLPQRGKVFKSSIMKQIIKMLDKAVKKAIK